MVGLGSVGGVVGVGDAPGGVAAYAGVVVGAEEAVDSGFVGGDVVAAAVAGVVDCHGGLECGVRCWGLGRDRLM